MLMGYCDSLWILKPQCHVVGKLVCVKCTVCQWRGDHLVTPVMRAELLSCESTPQHHHPVLTLLLPLAGFGGLVQIFNTSAWGAELEEARPLFEHRGHAPLSVVSAPVTVSVHIWHPEQPRTLLSAATDGSVHVWDWIDQSTGS